MARPAWHDNYLACYPALLERLKTVAGVKSVQEAKDLRDVTDPDNKKPPLDGAVYVVLDAFTSTSSNDEGREQDFEIGFSVILAKRNYTPDPAAGDGDVGATLTKICQSIQGFKPMTSDGRALTMTAFKSKPPMPIKYTKGFGFFPLRFVTTVTVISHN